MPRFTLFTIGHSTHTVEDFIAMLAAYGAEMLVDIRTIPRSQHNPQFNSEALAAALAAHGISYRWMKSLGGLRHARKDSPNSGWRNSGFRGYADYMQTMEFNKALQELMATAPDTKTAIMCAESVPWRCHRSLVADALAVHGVEVRHIMSLTHATAHKLTPFARIDGTTLTYPPETNVLFAPVEKPRK